ncbi:acyl-CoA dehydratase activase-related protein [Serpentinicella alkaliphila]|uniref:Putative nucleotide-binding protein (Sugar kinase/HSP70/actin superfamily) n=1 Tax=Serpentinicella alkaliphila TaxID=1734049 RepID=A0A4R2U3J1_9FIRM|nr:acyl-CoA dehydratase activase-related protein [Serpentinicella alkaliphila]QUH24555.1 hypothetical protein HZR23_01250 [Serpentinicella alkaliphila]TCQ04649.1 putative nucleotide-binding protein (sugar kinase/HSP70/actin superfamily) [Serpentinicella alkaliphila]
MKIGIPQSLLYAYYFPFWKTYFEELGHEVVVTPMTTKGIIDRGVKASVPEICVPIKIYLGHVITLLEEVDYIFVPRFVSIRKGQFFCPKFMGLPDMVRYTFKGIEEKLISPMIKTNSDNIGNTFSDYKFMEKMFGISSQKNIKALEKANEVWLRFREYSKKGYTITEAMKIVLDGYGESSFSTNSDSNSSVTIGLIGYVYNIYDSFISMDILNRLREMGVKVKTFEMLEEDSLEKELQRMNNKTMFWTFSDKLLAAGYSFYNNPEVDGLIHVTAFGCGPDSMLGKLLDMDTVEYNKPFMTVRVDEHTGENHLQTRIEAFIDMLKRRKMNMKRGA